MKNVYKRLSRAEAVVEAQKAESMDVLQSAYEKACEERNELDAARHIRKIRNQLLAESDSKMSLDRFGLVVPSGITFSAWLQFFKGIGSIITGEWAKYRKALRDLPEQEGFPFNIEFPVSPDENESEE